MPQRKTWRGKTWPAYVVLALSGLPLFGWIAWKEVNAGPVKRIAFEVDANDVVTLKARRRWVTVERPGFHWPRDEDSLFQCVRGFAREAEMDDYSFPVCPVRIAAEEGAHADTVSGLVVGIIMRNFLWDLTLESPGRTVKADLPKPGSQTPVPAARKRRDFTLGILWLPEAPGGQWRLETRSYKQMFRMGRPVAAVPAKRTRSAAYPRAPSLSLELAERWRQLLKLMDLLAATKGEVSLDRLEDGDFSKLKVVFVHWSATATAVDLVRAIEFLRGRHPSLKIVLVEPASR